MSRDRIAANVAANAEDEFLTGTGERKARAEQIRKAAGDTIIDERFAPLASDRPHALRGALARMVRQGQNDPEIQRAVPQGANESSRVLYVHQKGEGEIPVRCARVRGEWRASFENAIYSAESFDELASQLARAANRGPKQATAEQLRQVAVMASSGDFTRAVARLASIESGIPEELVLNGAIFDPNEADSFASNRLAPVWNRAVLFAWTAFRADVSPDEDFGAFAEQFAAGRPYSLALLNGAYDTYCKERENAARDAALTQLAQPEPETVPDFDDMSTEQLERELRGVKRFIARQSRTPLARIAQGN